jgi:hypothetical protein
MKSKQIIISILFVLTACLGLFEAYLKFSEQPKIIKKVEAKLEQPMYALVQNQALLSFERIEIIKIQHQQIYFNQDTLLFKKDTIQGVVYDLPKDEGQWKKTLITKLGNNKEQNFTTILSNLKSSFSIEWDNLSKQKSWNNLSDVQKCCHLLVNSIEANQNEVFYLNKNQLNRLPKSIIKPINHQQLELTSSKNEEVTIQNDWQNWLLPFGLLAVGILGLIFTNIKSIDKEVLESEPIKVEDTQTENLNTSEEDKKGEITENQEDLLLKYFQNFQERYGDFYTIIEQLPEYPNDESIKQKIKNQLIEMGLHAHSISRAFLFNYLHRPEKEPNVLLILNKQLIADLDPSLYKIATTDAYKTNKRYRFLAKILSEINIDALNGALMHDSALLNTNSNQPE